MLVKRDRPRKIEHRSGRLREQHSQVNLRGPNAVGDRILEISSGLGKLADRHERAAMLIRRARLIAGAADFISTAPNRDVADDLPEHDSGRSPVRVIRRRCIFIAVGSVSRPLPHIEWSRQPKLVSFSTWYRVKLCRR